MKLLFVHDTKFKEDNNGIYYTGGSYNEEVWNRYLSISSDFSVIARKEHSVYDSVIAEKKFNYFDKEKINFIEVPNLNTSIKGFLDFKERKKLNQIISTEVSKSNFIIARLPSSNGNIAIKYAKKFNKPYLVEVVGCSWDTLWNYNTKGKILAPFGYLKQKGAIKNSKYAIYVTNKFLQNRYPTKGKSVNCSNVLLTNISENVLESRLKKIHNINGKSKLTIGTIAAINVRYKGQETVIKALSELKKQGKINFEYQLVGGGSVDYLSSIAEKYDVVDQVKFLGSIPHNEVFKWLDTIDIYIQPSKTEGLPRSLVEAMSRGLLSIGTNVGGIPELIDHKYIIGSNKNNNMEIYEILKGIGKKELIQQAKRNHTQSKEYSKELIESRRQAFFKRFIDEN
ncbi:glycosyltransferase [Oceanobacillus luteolus]|uniref:Glycosyltransferase n=1 Tax=Oceanobacillus luteolus TaxID=1274358 RepID=A0ABW4HP65_9BACI